MISKFSKKELERLKCTSDEIDIIMKYQKKLPMPEADFEMNARMVHGYLGVKRDVSTWITGRIRKYEFKENSDYKISYECDDPKMGDIDFTSFSPTEMSRRGIRKEYYLTVTMAKELCTIENNELGRIARRYFILMEKIVEENKNWWKIRDPEMVEYKRMCEEINQQCFRMWHRKAYRADYAVEADLLNLIVMGKTSKELKAELHISTFDLLRDYLKKEHNEELLFLEQQNQVLLQMDMGYTERRNFLTQMHKARFKKDFAKTA